MGCRDWREYIDEEFAGLYFFEVKEFYSETKIITEFLQEQNHYEDTEPVSGVETFDDWGPCTKKIRKTSVTPKCASSKDIVSKMDRTQV